MIFLIKICCVKSNNKKKSIMNGQSVLHNVLRVMAGVMDVSVLVVLWFIHVWFAERQCCAEVCI